MKIPSEQPQALIQARYHLVLGLSDQY
ncbi:uncharacterized protein METZ01_LOCUS211356 [marine metagenome]|uniref:Uncharacterized protein n=1 Tax=marine metagenome TaxID=408172 RepID=A0A382F797_9ZZZZ